TSVLPGVRSSNVLVVIVVGSMAWLNVAVTLVPVATLTAPADGTLLVTVGGGAIVVNDQTTLAASAFPARSLTTGAVAPPWIVAVSTVEWLRAAAGVSVTVRVTASYETVAGTTVLDGVRSSTVLDVIVEGSIASLNVAVTVVETATLVEPAAGKSPAAVGG